MLIDDMRELADYRARIHPDSQKHAEVAVLLHRLAQFGAWASYRPDVGLTIDNTGVFVAMCGDVLDRLPRSVERSLYVLAKHCAKGKTRL